MPNLYDDSTNTALTTDFAEFDLGDNLKYLRVTNEEAVGGKVIYISWDGTNTHEKILPGQTANFDVDFFEELDVPGDDPVTSVWLKSVAAGAAYNLSANG